jgi:hypothetical protein
LILLLDFFYQNISRIGGPTDGLLELDDIIKN